MSAFPALLERRARLQPDRVAIRVDGIGELTFAEWQRRVAATAHALAAAGHGRGARIGLHFDNATYLDYAVACVAALRAAAVAVPLPRALPAAELARMERKAGVSVHLHAPLDLGSGPEPRSALPEARPDDLAEILFTSGSTGAPKAVAVTHANLAGEIDLGAATHGAHDTQLHAVPLGTNWGQFALRAGLSAGIASIVMPAFDAQRMLELIEDRQPIELLLAPPMALLLLDAARGSEAATGSVATVRLSGAPAAADTLVALSRLFPSATVHVGYSSTEASPACTLMEFPGDPPDTVGRAPSGAEVQVVGPGGDAVPSGRLGEVRLRSRLAPPRAYLEPDVGARAVFDDGWVRTGDVGWIDEAGYLHLRGRTADVINVGGAKVFAPEVEAVLMEHPAVLEASVVGLGSRLLGEHVVAAVVTAGPVDPGALGRFVRERLAAHKRPAVIRIVDALPKGASGKVSKPDLRLRLERMTDASQVPGPDELERHLLALWSEALDVPGLGPDDDLPAHGADSLTAFAVLARLEERSGAAVPPSRFLVLPTVRAQTRMVAASASPSARSIASSSPARGTWRKPGPGREPRSV